MNGELRVRVRVQVRVRVSKLGGELLHQRRLHHPQHKEIGINSLQQREFNENYTIELNLLYSTYACHDFSVVQRKQKQAKFAILFSTTKQKHTP